jgi:hypothetical protein
MTVGQAARAFDTPLPNSKAEREFDADRPARLIFGGTIELHPSSRMYVISFYSG